MIDYNRVLEVVRKTLEANSELGLALAFVEAGDVILGALHAAAAADLLAAAHRLQRGARMTPCSGPSGSASRLGHWRRRVR